MRKLILLFICVVLVFGLVACATQNQEGVPTPQDSDAVSNESTVVEQTKFEQFAAGLDAAGISYETVTMAADLVGAVQGVKYKIGDGKIELYQFDPNSESFPDVSQNKRMTLEGFGAIPVEVNGDMAILIDDIEDEATVLNIFNNLQ